MSEAALARFGAGVYKDCVNTQFGTVWLRQRPARHDAAVNDLRPALGARIKELRSRLGISQEELASRAGVHWTYLSDLERGRQTPTLDMLNRVARGLSVTLGEFFSPFDELYRARFRKARRDAARRKTHR